MHLTIFNGSPRKGANNTAMLLAKFLDGFGENASNTFEIYKLNLPPDLSEAVEAYRQADCVLLAFPLYIYAVPAGVKDFIERLAPCRDLAGKKIGFLVQYGFPEALHARPLERYLEELARILNGVYLGTIIKGGCDGLTRYPERVNRKTFTVMRAIGENFGRTGAFDRALLDAFARPERFSALSRLLFNLFMKLGNRVHWDSQLKRNGAFEHSWDRPYVMRE